jgi:2,4-dienoyl-CoA reductase-like NADH-dependent reductase (Old Yellow Enzyme family)
MAERAGFDAVEVHLGHNYLASAFLSPKLNRRKDEYGAQQVHADQLHRDPVRAHRRALSPDRRVGQWRDRDGRRLTRQRIGHVTDPDAWSWGHGPGAS